MSWPFLYLVFFLILECDLEWVLEPEWWLSLEYLCRYNSSRMTGWFALSHSTEMIGLFSLIIEIYVCMSGTLLKHWRLQQLLSKCVPNLLLVGETSHIIIILMICRINHTQKNHFMKKIFKYLIKSLHSIRFHTVPGQ